MFIMELSEKLQELRKEKGLTQEELAEALFVSPLQFLSGNPAEEFPISSH